jgi:hypothetical protein
MNARLGCIAAFISLAGASLVFAQTGFVPAGSIVVDCEEGCHIEMPAFGLVDVAEPQETLSLGGLPAGAHDLRIESGPDSWDLTVTVCGTATAVRVGGGDATIEPPPCAPFGFLAVTLPQGARADVARRTLRASTTAAMYVGVYDILFTKPDGERETTTVVVSEGMTTEVGLAPTDATVTFVGVPANAIVRFSRTGSLEGPGPHGVPPGLHIVEIDAPGYIRTSFTLQLEAGVQLEREVRLEPLPPGYARFIVTPATATIEIAGDTYYPGDLIPLVPREYVATVAAPGYDTATVPITIDSEATSTVEVRLSAILGRLVMQVEPPNALVQIADNTFAAGETTSLTPGDYLATVTAPGYETAKVPVTIVSGATSTIEVRLIEALGRLELRVEPRNAVVRIAGNTYAAGETAQLAPNAYTVVISAPGFEAFEGHVTIAPATNNVLEVRLAQSYRVSISGDFGAATLHELVDLIGAPLSGSITLEPYGKIAYNSEGDLFRAVSWSRADPGPPLGGRDILLMRMESTGRYDRYVRFGTDRDELVIDLVVTRDGGLVVLHAFTAADGRDVEGYVLTRYDANLESRWSRVIDPEWRSGRFGQQWVLRAAATGPDDGVSVVGSYYGERMRTRMVYVASFDSTGEPRWANGYHYVDNDTGGDIAIDGRGNVFIAGTANSSAGSGLALLAKLDADGGMMWHRVFGDGDAGDFAPTITNLNSVDLDSAGNVYVAGDTNASVAATNASPGRDDGLVASFTASGTLRWIRQFGTAALESTYALAVDHEDRILVVGLTRGALGAAHYGGNDAFIAAWDAHGGQLFVDQFGTSEDEYAIDLVTFPGAGP